MNVKKALKPILGLFLFFCSMFVQAETVWIDVRSSGEYKMDHIDDELLIPHTKIAKEVISRFPNSETQIHVYYGSGNRAGKAKSALKKAG